MTAICTFAEYRERISAIQALKHCLSAMASQRGNLDPDVIRISQEMDEHIVSVQQYWQHYGQGDALPITG
jgi:hypothetical protein